MNARELLCLNRVAKPQLPLLDFLRFTASLGMKRAEVRNDFTEKGVLDGLSDEELRGGLASSGVQILSINALYPFEYGPRLAENFERLRDLVAEARRIGCPHVVMCPYNEAGDPRPGPVRASDLVAALDAYGPLLSETGVVGLLEPLGFETSALRTKRAALDGVARCTRPDSFRLLHDTFHHYLGEERELFPRETGLIHVSGVLAGKAKAAITDDDRVLVDHRDVMGSRDQVRALLASGCRAPISYEPFSPSVRAMALPELKEALLRSIDYLLA